jgi:hypothetical protein
MDSFYNEKLIMVCTVIPAQPFRRAFFVLFNFYKFLSIFRTFLDHFSKKIAFSGIFYFSKICFFEESFATLAPPMVSIN